MADEKRSPDHKPKVDSHVTIDPGCLKDVPTTGFMPTGTYAGKNTKVNRVSAIPLQTEIPAVIDSSTGGKWSAHFGTLTPGIYLLLAQGDVDGSTRHQFSIGKFTAGKRDVTSADPKMDGTTTGFPVAGPASGTYMNETIVSVYAVVRLTGGGMTIGGGGPTIYADGIEDDGQGGWSATFNSPSLDSGKTYNLVVQGTSNTIVVPFST
jgi:hypothetical protein